LGKLFPSVFEVKPILGIDKGLIEEEMLMLSYEDMENLYRNEIKMGILSGRPRKSAIYRLKPFLKFFKEKAVFFLEDLIRDKSDLMKPNPHFLLEAAKELKPYKQIMYLGDSIEDALMVKRANERGLACLFGAVYKHDENLRLRFMHMNSDLLLPSTRYLPKILEAIKNG
jgi:phosphoglycolate phosphatase-like HAD superfamily hydrolase